MKLAFFARGLCAAGLLVTLAACGGGGAGVSDAGAPGAPLSSQLASANSNGNANGPKDGNVPTPSLRCAP